MGAKLILLKIILPIFAASAAITTTAFVIVNNHKPQESPAETTTEQTVADDTAKPQTEENSGESTPDQAPEEAATPDEDKPTPTPATPSAPATPQQPSAPSTPAPSTPATPEKKPDYNLNDKWLVSDGSTPLFKRDENNQCVFVRNQNFFTIVKFDGSGNEFVGTALRWAEYSEKNGYATDCGGNGISVIPTTWEERVSQGLALDEAKCAQYGLSCGRW